MGTDTRTRTAETNDRGTSPLTRDDIVARALGGVGLIVIALIHYSDANSKYAAADARYIFWLYVALILGCAIGVGALILRNTRATWAFTTLLGVGPFISYIVNRSIGFPRATDDIGNWGEPLGIVSLIVEVLVIALSLAQLARLTREQSRQS